MLKRKRKTARCKWSRIARTTGEERNGYNSNVARSSRASNNPVVRRGLARTVARWTARFVAEITGFRAPVAGIVRSIPPSFTGCSTPNPWPSLRRVPVHRAAISLSPALLCLSLPLSTIGTSLVETSTFQADRRAIGRYLFGSYAREPENMLPTDRYDRSLCSFYAHFATATGAKCSESDRPRTLYFCLNSDRYTSGYTLRASSIRTSSDIIKSFQSLFPLGEF